MTTTTTETTTASGVPVLLTVEQFCQRHPWAKVGGLRHLLFHDTDGFRDACTLRFGRKLLLDEAAVFAWLRTQGTHRGAMKGPTPPKKKASPKGR